jgi:hypothetical protein
VGAFLSTVTLMRHTKVLDYARAGTAGSMGLPLASAGAAPPLPVGPAAAPVALCQVQHQKLCLAVDLKAQTLIG